MRTLFNVVDTLIATLVICMITVCKDCLNAIQDATERANGTRQSVRHWTRKTHAGGLKTQLDIMRAVIGIITKQNERRDYMAVIDEVTKQQAKELWLEGKKYKEISEITGIKESSIKSLASRIWKKEELQPNRKKVANKVAVANRDKGPPKTELLPEEIETLNNEELTERQRLFCLYYVRWFNATKAYRKVYDCDYTTAMTNGSMLLRNTKIQEHIQAIKTLR